MSRNSENGSTNHGYNIQTTSIVVLNALGFIGFKVIAVAGTVEVRIVKQSLHYRIHTNGCQKRNIQSTFTARMTSQSIIFREMQQGLGLVQFSFTYSI